MRADRTKIWDSVGLQERFTDLVGSCMKRGDLLRLLSLNADDLVILSAPGYHKVIMFHNCAAPKSSTLLSPVHQRILFP